MANLSLKTVNTKSDLERAYVLMRELRTHLDLNQYVALTTEAMRQGYVLLAAVQDDHWVGLMGYRILTDLVHGRHLYIDDLVIAEKVRSKGYGARLLHEAKVRAREEGCQRLRLCTGVENARGKTFYESNGWNLRAVVYKSSI